MQGGARAPQSVPLQRPFNLHLINAVSNYVAIWLHNLPITGDVASKHGQKSYVASQDMIRLVLMLNIFLPTNFMRYAA